MLLVLKRRSILATGAMTIAGLSSGCLTAINGESSQDATKVDFTEKEGQHLLVVRNERERSVEATITTVENDSAGEYSTQTTLDAGEAVEITELFTSDADSHTIRVETDNAALERTISMQGSPRQQSEFEISSAGIEYERVHRRAADIAVSNHRETRASFRITVVEPSSNDPPVYDTVELLSDDFESYTDVFTIGTEYEVTVEVADQRSSTPHLSSYTNGVSVTLDEDGLEVGEFEQ